MSNEVCDWNIGGSKTYTEDDISAAIEAGVISAESAAALSRYISEKPVPVADEEYFRLVGGFNDIFVTVTCLLLLVPLNWLLGSYGCILIAALSWGLAEYFIRRKRLALTSIILLFSFAGSIYLFVLVLLGALFFTEDRELVYNIIITGIVTAGAVFGHWKRFRVPITVACGVSAAAVSLISLLILAFTWAGVPDIIAATPVITLIMGIAIFLFAMRWDVSDPARQTRRSDVAFWLHLLAAPVIMHSFFYLIGVFKGDLHLWQSCAIILIYIGLAFVSVAIDRRSLMVSSLGYVLYAFSDLFRRYGDISDYFALAALIISLPLLLLSALWQPARALVYRCLPEPLQRLLPRV